MTEDIVNFCKEVKAVRVKILTLVARGNVHNHLEQGLSEDLLRGG